MIRALTLGLLASVVTTSVMAADLFVEEPIAEAAIAAYDWNGAYIGAFVGGGWGVADWDSGFDDIDLSGWLAGAAIGANFQAGSFVLGVEGDVAWSNIGATIVCPTVRFDCSTDINWLATLRGRAGFAADTALFYVTAGLAVADVTSQTIDTVTPTIGGLLEATYVGWAAGVGAEVAVTEDITLKAEYLYVDLGSQDDSGAAAPLNLTPTTVVGVTAHTLKAGLNFQF